MADDEKNEPLQLPPGVDAVQFQKVLGDLQKQADANAAAQGDGSQIPAGNAPLPPLTPPPGYTNQIGTNLTYKVSADPKGFKDAELKLMGTQLEALNKSYGSNTNDPVYLGQKMALETGKGFLEAAENDVVREAMEELGRARQEDVQKHGGVLYTNMVPVVEVSAPAQTPAKEQPASSRKK